MMVYVDWVCTVKQLMSWKLNDGSIHDIFPDRRKVVRVSGEFLITFGMTFMFTPLNFQTTYCLLVVWRAKTLGVSSSLLKVSNWAQGEQRVSVRDPAPLFQMIESVDNSNVFQRRAKLVEMTVLNSSSLLRHCIVCCLSSASGNALAQCAIANNRKQARPSAGSASDQHTQGVTWKTWL